MLNKIFFWINIFLFIVIFYLIINLFNKENFETKPRLLVLLTCFFNYEYIDRTLKSIENNNYNCDIILLENPSKYSNEIKNLKQKYKISKHYICNENVEGNVITLFINNYRDIINNYEYIAISDADVVLEKDSINEAIQILDMNDDNVGNVSIDLDLNYEKYDGLPLNSWVPSFEMKNNYKVGATGIQFVIFKKQFLFDFFDAINEKKLNSGIALGTSEFYGFSDSNLILYNNIQNKLWVRTQNTKLDHIGWELYLDNDNEYVKYKDQMLKEQKIRVNIDLNNKILSLVN